MLFSKLLYALLSRSEKAPVSQKLAVKASNSNGFEFSQRMIAQAEVRDPSQLRSDHPVRVEVIIG